MTVEQTLDGLVKDLTDTTKLDTVGTMAVETIRGHLVKGDGFDPLSPATIDYRGNGKPLQDTGSLRDSFTYKKTGDDTVVVGTTKPYASVHNNGKTIRAKKEWLWIPAEGTRQLQRKYGYSPTAVCNGLRASGLPVYRVGRTVCYSKGSGKKKYSVVVYYLKKEVVIPKREFFFLTQAETDAIVKEITPNAFL